MKKKGSGNRLRCNRHKFDISASEMGILQATDATMWEVRIAIKEHESASGVGFFVQKMDTSGWVSGVIEVKQLVLPKSCRQKYIAHSFPLEDIWERTKLLIVFYSISTGRPYRDITNFCRFCEFTKRRQVKAPLPIISQQFERIALDVIRPLPKSSRGNYYVVVICDYATCYQEAVQLKQSTLLVWQENYSSRVGILKYLDTDRPRYQLYLTASCWVVMNTTCSAYQNHPLSSPNRCSSWAFQ